MKIKVSDFIWSYLEKQGVRHVFMFPGGGAMHLVDSLGRNKKIEYVTLLHEQACAIATETYSRIAEKTGVSLVTTGPGGTNAVTGVAAAWLESTPCLIISGQVKTSQVKPDGNVRQMGNQEIGIIDLVKTITKYSILITDPYSIKYHLEKALYLANEGRPGPVWLDIPLDIQSTVVEEVGLENFLPDQEFIEKTPSIEKQVSEALEMLKVSKRPVLIAGQGIERNKGRYVFRELVDLLKIPVMTSWIATELLEFNHQYHLGKPGLVAPRYSNFAVQNADCVITIGTRLDPAMIGYDQDNFAPNAKKIIVDIDECELNKFNFHAEMKIKSDATVFVNEMISQLKQKNIKVDVEEWLSKCDLWKKKYPIVQDEYRQNSHHVNPYYFVEQLSERLSETDVIIPGSSGAGIDVFWLTFKNKRDQRLLATGALGAMGYGIPAAIGACIAAGRKRTICVEGDGSLQLNIQELASIVGMNLPIKLFVLDNGGFLSIMNMQRTHFNGNFVGAEKNSKLYLPDIRRVAEAYGFKTFVINDHEDIGEKITEVLDSDGPVLCNVLMSSELSIQPRVTSEIGADGIIRSKPLEDLWPYLDRDEFEEIMQL